MKFTLRDLCWLLLTVGIALGWYVHSRWHVSLRAGDVISMVQIGFDQEPQVNIGIVSSVTADTLQVDVATSGRLPQGIAIDESGECLGVVYSEDGHCKVRRLSAIPYRGPRGIVKP